ncbi:hypothetical protein WICPIJ_002676 [Wickerhamomyces pijperi]|uniref:Uncharacterized protein n=1 Tax=Wickerhamomyces pijperi TaxID=599730 RepID=A0A9P8TPK8_WICPI|nr:hypothetical protein WICPIJ_002676 [Wickerhamomyces pijperi]
MNLKSYYKRTIFSAINQEESVQPKRTSDDYARIPFNRFDKSVPSPDEVLLQMKNAPKLIPVKERNEKGLEDLPDSDLLEALHYYYSRNFVREGLTVNPFERQMDESALLALGMIVEQMVEEFVAKDGYFQHAVDEYEQKIIDTRKNASGKTKLAAKSQSKVHKKPHTRRTKKSIKHSGNQTDDEQSQSDISESENSRDQEAEEEDTSTLNISTDHEELIDESDIDQDSSSSEESSDNIDDFYDAEEEPSEED